MSERFEQRRAQFLRALDRLQESAALPEDSIVRDALIQRFEFTFEMAWRALHRHLLDQQVPVAEHAFAVFQEALKARLIDDVEAWNQIRLYRNQTSHTYDETKAVEVAAFVRARALATFAQLGAVLERL